MDWFINLFDPAVFAWVIVPILIALARVMDVSIGTLRIILISKGYRAVAPFLGFIEIFIWILAVSQIMQHLDKFLYYIAYATGYAVGTYIGMRLESKLSLGNVVIRVITNQNSTELLEILKQEQYNFTTVDAEGKFGKVKMIFMISQRHLLDKTIELLELYQPSAFYSVEDVRYVKEGSLPGGSNPNLALFKRATKSSAVVHDK